MRELKLPAPISDPIDFVPKFCCELHVSAEVEELATKFIAVAVKKSLTQGRTPQGVTAAAIYLAAALKCEKITQKKLSKIASITEVTLRTNYKLISKYIINNNKRVNF